VNETMMQSVEFSGNAFNLLQLILSPSKDESSYPCLGRHLCKLGSQVKGDVSSSAESISLKLVTFALMWVQLEDRSQSFVQFLDNVTRDDFDEHLDCDYIFYKCQHS